MKIAVTLGVDWDTIGGITDTKANVAHVCGVLHTSCATALAKRGHDVDILLFSKVTDNHGKWPFRVIPVQDAYPGDYDALISIEATFWTRAEAEKWAKHSVLKIDWGNCLYLMDGLKYGKYINRYAVTSLSPILYSQYEKKYGAARVFYIPQSAPVWPSMPCPYEEDNRKIRCFWTGIIKESGGGACSQLDFINGLAEYDDLDIWLVALFPTEITGSPIIRGLTDAERAKLLNPKINLVSDHIGFLPHLGHGAVYCGQYAAYLEHADVGLNHYVGPHASAKVYEYLLNGVPVVIPDECDEWRVIKKYGGGWPFKIGDIAGVHDIISKFGPAIKPEAYCDTLKSIYNNVWGWDRSAEILEREIMYATSK